MTKRWKRLLALASLLLLVLLAWLLWPDRRMAQAKALQKELTGPQAKNLSPEQRREKWQQYRKLTEKLTPAQRNDLSAESRKRRQQEIARYFAMTPQEKTKHLDERIKAMEKMRQQAQAKGGGSPRTGGQNANSAGASQRPGGGNGTPGRGGPGQSGDRSAAARDHGRQDRLDSTSPAERAMFAQYAKDVQARRAQLGLPPMGRGPR